MGILREESSSRLRASLRGLLPAIATLALFVAGLAVLGTLFASPTETGSWADVLPVLVVQILLYLVVIGAAVWIGATLEHREYTAFGLNVDAGWLRNFVAGTTITVLGIALSLWWAQFRGLRNVDLTAVDVTGPGGPVVLVVVFAVFVCFMLLGNVYEEIVYRRILLRNFTEGLATRGVGTGAAVVVATVASLSLFGLYHVPLRGSVVVAIDAALVGVPLAVAYLFTGKLGLPIGLHFGRLPIEFMHGLTLGGFEVQAAVVITRNTLPANLEVKLLRVGLICALVFVWVALDRGTVRLAEPIPRRTTEETANSGD